MLHQQHLQQQQRQQVMEDLHKMGTAEVQIKVLMKRALKDKIDWFVNNYDKEIAGWLTGTIEGDSIILEDLLIPNQEADAGGVEMTGKQIVELRKEYGDECTRIKGEWHSHNTMRAFWSATDEAFMEQFSEPREVCIFIVSSKDDGHKIRVEIRKPFRISVDDLEYEVIDEEDDKLGEELKAEIEKKVTLPVSNYTSQSSTQTTFSKARQDVDLGERISQKTKYYNADNSIEINDLNSYHAEQLVKELEDMCPEMLGQGGEMYSVKFTFTKKKKAKKAWKKIKEVLIPFIEEEMDMEDAMEESQQKGDIPIYGLGQYDYSGHGGYNDWRAGGYQ